MATPARIMESARLALHPSYTRERAIEAFKVTRRRRRLRSTYDTVADAALATGGLVLANATLQFGMGLPEGRNGIALGGALVAGGMLWLTRIVRGGGGRKDPAVSAAVPLLMVVDTEQARKAA